MTLCGASTSSVLPAPASVDAFQFWIPKDDLAKADWAAVRLTFEMDQPDRAA